MMKFDLKRAGAAGLAAASVASAGAVVVPASPSAAASCRVYDDDTNAPSSTYSFWYPNDFVHSVPSSSDCKDIQIEVFTGDGCNEYRIRWMFDNSTTGWKNACEGDGWVVLAQGATNGFEYRVESHYSREHFWVMD